MPKFSKGLTKGRKLPKVRKAAPSKRTPTRYVRGRVIKKKK